MITIQVSATHLVFYLIMICLLFGLLFLYFQERRRNELLTEKYSREIENLKQKWDDDIRFAFDRLRERLDYFLGDGVYIKPGDTHSILLPQKRVNIPSWLRHEVLSSDEFKCRLCGRRQGDGVVLEVDHKLPVSKGGTNERYNLWTLCETCNAGKRERILAEWVKIEKLMIDSSWYYKFGAF